MKRLFLAATAIAAILSASGAMAADQDHQNDRGQQQNGDNANSPNTGPGDAGNTGPSDNRGDGAGDRNGAHAGPGNAMGGPEPNNARSNQMDRGNMAGPATAAPRAIAPPRPTRTTIMKVRANIQAPRHFHAGAYRQPAGWTARRWTFGQRLPRNYFARDYWITDFALYGLMEPWDGFEWVRVGDDALLVDIDTGEVIRVEYGVFY